MSKTEITEIECAAIDRALHVFVRSQDYQVRFPNKTQSMDQYLSGSRPFMEKIVGDATMKLDQILAAELQRAAEAGHYGIEIHGLTFAHLGLEQEDGETTKVTSVLMSDEGNPVCQMRWTFEKNDDDVKVTLTIAECPKDNPTYPYANRLAISSIFRPGTEFGLGAHATAWLPDFRKFVNVMDHLREPLQEQLKTVDLGAPYMGLDISRHQLDMELFQAVVDLDGGLPGDLCRIAGKTMLDTAASKCFQYTGDAFGHLVKRLKSKKAIFGQKFLAHSDHDNFVSVASCEATGEDALIMYAEGKVTLVTVENAAKGKPSKAVTYHLEAGSEAVTLITGWISGQREFSAPAAEYDFNGERGGSIKLADKFIEEDGGTVIGADIYHAFEAIKNMKKRDDVEISQDFDYFMELIGPIDEPEGDYARSGFKV